MGKNSSNNYLGGGLTFMQALFLVFLVLKLTETTVVATWSWWWVTAPLWVPFALFMFLVTLACIASAFNR